MRQYLLVSAFIVISTLMLTGCGDHGGKALGPSAATTAKGRGGITFTVKWPTAVKSRVIPDATTSIVVKVTQNGAEIAGITMTRNPGEVSVTKTLDNIPTGVTTLRATANDAAGTVLASGASIVTVELAKTVPAHLVLYAGGANVNPTDGAAMVWVPGGTFTMGTEYDAWWGTPYTQQVTLSGYWIYTYEVTVAQYRAFCAATGHALPPWPGNYYSWTDKTGWDDATLQQHPIVNVTWYDAKAYADWAGVTLPTEAQWEYAARGPAGNNYPWGGTATANDPYNGWDQTKCANYYNSNAQNISTWPVGSFPAGGSWCGAHDLAGNVWEWCMDWYGLYSSTLVTNPSGPATGDDRVLRGGSWINVEIYYRGAVRSIGIPRNYWGYGGFRCVSFSPGP